MRPRRAHTAASGSVPHTQTCSRNPLFRCRTSTYTNHDITVCYVQLHIVLCIIDDVIGRAGASPPSRATGVQFLRPCDRCFVENHNLKDVTTLRQRSLDRGKRGALSEASTSCQRASHSGECQGKRKAPLQRNSDWFFYYRVKEFIIFVSSFLLQ